MWPYEGYVIKCSLKPLALESIAELPGQRCRANPTVRKRSLSTVCGTLAFSKLQRLVEKSSAVLESLKIGRNGMMGSSYDRAELS